MHPDLRPILLEWKKEWQIIHYKWWHRENVETRRTKRELLPDHQWVFINPKRHGERAKSFSKAFYASRKATNLPITPYTLRHYFISQCVMSNLNIFCISKFVGHSNTRMIEEVYGHLSNDFRKEQMALLKII